MRLVPFGAFAGLGTVAAVGDLYGLATLFGVGALATGRRLLDRRRNARKELWRRVQENDVELRRVAWADWPSAFQMKRLRQLQHGLLESWELLPKEYGLLLFEDLHTVVDEVEAAARLARRRVALRRHLKSSNRTALTLRIGNLERQLERLEEGSALRASLEAALAGRRGELAGREEVGRAVGMIDAQLEGIESLLGNLRAELLALDASPGTSLPAAESRLVGLKQRVAYFRRSLEEVGRSLDRLPGGTPHDDGLDEALPERMTVR